MDRSSKEELVGDLHKAMLATSCLIVTHQTGLNAAEVTSLRRQMRDAGCSYKVTKNRLMRLALAGTKFEQLSSLFTGPTAIAYSKDPVAAAKVAVEFAGKNDKLTIIGGGLDAVQLDVNGVKALATMPSLDTLRGKLLGLLQTPASRIASVLQAPGGQLARVLNAYATKGDEAA
ncbi:MAG TPA: 50S ribosomal protein L10 [Aliidongia sp.]|nr:50S ribosomal protein L10 [Aliidongia sp.]